MQNIANSPARPALTGRRTSKVTIMTEKKTIPLAIKIARRNRQLTEVRSSLASDMKIRDGSEKVPTKVLRPFASVSEIKLRRPAA